MSSIHIRGGASTPPLQNHSDRNSRKFDSDRFRQHWLKQYDCDPRAEQVYLLRNARQRIPQFFRRTTTQPWQIQGLKAQLAARRLRVHEKVVAPTAEPGELPALFKARKVRTQRHHTDTQMFNLFLDYVNVQLGEPKLSFLELRELPIQVMCAKTGFSESTVTAALARYTQGGLLRTERRKNEERDRERPARRWLTPAFFSLLGLGKKLAKQKRRGVDTKELAERSKKRFDAQRAQNPGRMPESSATTNTGNTGSTEVGRDALNSVRAHLGMRRRPPDG